MVVPKIASVLLCGSTIALAACPLTWGSRWSVWIASLGSAFVVAIG